MGRALAADWPATLSHDGQVLELVCRPNLDVHSGTAGVVSPVARQSAPRRRAGRARPSAGGGRPAGALHREIGRYLWLDRAQRARDG
jgi:hypothetical protein